MADTYWQDVIDPGDKASAFAKEIGFQSHENNSAVDIVPLQPGNFRGPVGFLWKPQLLTEMSRRKVQQGKVVDWELIESVEDDGAGGKLQFDTLCGTEEAFVGTSAEIIAMTADDFARSGRYPVIIDNEANFKRITPQNFHLVQSAFRGFGERLKDARLINITGEIAVMKHSITAFCDMGTDEQLIMTWGASCLGLARKSMMIDWSDVVPDLPILGFWEPGYRCNGGTFFTNVIQAVWGKDPRSVMSEETGREFIRRLTIPSVSYARVINDLQGWNSDGTEGIRLARIYGIAHITGGGVWSKFGEMLPEGVGAELDKMPLPASVLADAQELSWPTAHRLSDWEAYRTLHGGCGMLLVCDRESIPAIGNLAEKAGVVICEVGKTTASIDREILIQSRFRERKELSSLHPE